MEYFKPKVEALIELMANPLEKRTKEALAESVGLSRKHVYKLQKDKDFQEAIRTRMRQYLSVNLPRVYATLFQLATDEKDVQACRLLLQAAGELGDKGVHVVTNVTQQNTPGSDEESLDEAIVRCQNERREAARVGRRGCDEWEDRADGDKH